MERLGFIIFEIISLKWIKLTNFGGWRYFMPNVHLKQPEFTYSACGQFIKYHEWIQKF